MKTALCKDQTGRPRVKSKSDSKSAIAKSRKKSALDAALKMYAEYNKNKARNKISRTLNTESSKASGCGNQNFQLISSYNVSICPVKRPVSSIEMGLPV